MFIKKSKWGKKKKNYRGTLIGNWAIKKEWSKKF